MHKLLDLKLRLETAKQELNAALQMPFIDGFTVVVKLPHNKHYTVYVYGNDAKMWVNPYADNISTEELLDVIWGATSFKQYLPDGEPYNE